MRTNIASLCSISSLSSDDMWTLKNISVVMLSSPFPVCSISWLLKWPSVMVEHTSWLEFFLWWHLFLLPLTHSSLGQSQRPEKKNPKWEKSRLKTSQAYVLVKCAPHKSLSIMKNAFMFQLCLQVHWWYRNRTNVWYISELPFCEFWFFFLLWDIY